MKVFLIMTPSKADNPCAAPPAGPTRTRSQVA